MIYLRTFLAVSMLLAVAGCGNQIREMLEPLTPAPKVETAAAPRVSGPVETQTPPPLKAEVAPGKGGGVQPKGAVEEATGDITMNFIDTDIREIVRTVLGGLLKVTYTVDPGVHGTGTIQTANPVSREKAIELLETLLAQNGASLSVNQGVYRVAANAATAMSSNLVGTDNFGSGTKIVQLRYASAADLATVLEPFLTPGGKIIPDANRNVLLVSGDAPTRNSLEQVIHAFDIDLLAGKSFALFPVQSGDPEKVASELDKALLTGENGALASVVKIVPMDRVNAVLVVSSQARYIDDVRRIFALVDKVSQQTIRTWHVYYVRNGQSTDLEYVLQRAFTPENVTSTGQSDTNRLGSTVPGLQIGQMGANNGAGATGGTTPGSTPTSTGGSPTGGMQLSLANQSSPSSSTSSQQSQQQRPAAASTPATDSLSSGAKKPTDSIRIIANKTNNAVLIYATPTEYKMIEAMLNKIDILPLQVQIDAVIAEVDLNDQLQYGVQFYFQNGGLSGILSQNSTGLPLSASFPGFVLAKASSAVQFTISALQSITNVRVLSSPQITVLDNETATLSVGDQVPYLTQTASILSGATTAGAPIVNSIAYQETGVILQVIPRVNSGGLVTLDIAQEVSQPTTTTTSTIGSPTFSDRVVKSRVVVHDGQTIGLAGLISDNDSRINGGLPWIKDIPVLGALTGNQANQRQRTELLVLLTPHVDYDQREVQKLTEDLRAKVGGASLVPQQLNTLRPTGSDDPNKRIRGEH